MASGQDKVQLEVLPAVFQSAMWEHFGFRVTCDSNKKEGQDDMATVCKHCATRLAYANSNK